MSVLHEPRRVCVRGTHPSPRTRRMGHPAVLVMPARSKAWATPPQGTLFAENAKDGAASKD
jgi:hypothetical protein